MNQVKATLSYFQNLFQGDSGGPLVVSDPDGRWTIVGLTSYGFGCARPNMPGVYARITSFLPMIEKYCQVADMAFTR